MVRIQQVSADFLDRKRRRARSAEAEAQREQFRELMLGLKSTADAFLVALDSTDKPATVRQRLLRVAFEVNKKVAVRRHPEGFVVGLMTPERQSTRGRKAGPVSSSATQDVVRLRIGDTSQR